MFTIAHGPFRKNPGERHIADVGLHQWFTLATSVVYTKNYSFENTVNAKKSIFL